MNAPAAEVARRFTRAGMPCEIEAGPVGLIVYAASPGVVVKIAAQLAAVARLRDPKAHIAATVEHDDDELPATAWWVVVVVDWDRF